MLASTMSRAQNRAAKGSTWINFHLRGILFIYDVQGASPLLNTVSLTLRGVGSLSAGCARPSPPVTPTPRPVDVTEVWDDGSGKSTTAWTASPQTTQATTTPEPTTTATATTTTAPSTTSASVVPVGVGCVEGEFYK